MYTYSGVVTNIIDEHSMIVKVDLGFRNYTSMLVYIKGISDEPRPARKEWLKNNILNKKIWFVSHKDRSVPYDKWYIDAAFDKDFLGMLLYEEIIKQGMGSPKPIFHHSV